MAENKNDIDHLLHKLEFLLRRQEDFAKEVNELRLEIIRLKLSQEIEKSPSKEENPEQSDLKPEVTDNDIIIPPIPQSNYLSPQPVPVPRAKLNTEKFIGENLISKIGIIITVIGVAIGAKYSIDHELISPAARIILGYLVGFGLLGFGYKLKKAYPEFSAVLVSGSIAILYFITYAAYSFYGLMPQLVAFSVMVLFTIFSVVAAIHYNRQVIAHIGLVGAYAIPLLLSQGSGNVAVLFTYIAIINVGILFIAIRKYWKPLYYSSFIITWLIFLSWYVTKYETNNHFVTFWTFLFIFFTTFYLIFLAYKLLKKEKFLTEDIILILTNSFIFYGLGYSILDDHMNGNQLLGIFTVSNAFIHFCVGAVIYRQKIYDRSLFLLVAGLVLLFITLAIPVQLDGNWVTLLWAGEAALLFWIGRSRKESFYEKLSYVLMILAFSSLVADWINLYFRSSTVMFAKRFPPVFNINFLSSLLFAIAFVFIYYIHRNKKLDSDYFYGNKYRSIIDFSIPAILLVVLYYAFRLEISTYWNQLYVDSMITTQEEGQDYPVTYYNEDFIKFKTTWIINYSLVFLSLLALINIRIVKDRIAGFINIGLGFLFVIVFLTQGLYVLSELIESFINQMQSQYPSDNFNIWIRYISFACVGLMLVSLHKYLQQEFMIPNRPTLKVAFDLLFYSCLLWIASSELISWTGNATGYQSHKLQLSILWGVFALLLIVIGLWKKKKHLRIAAIVLFSVTLIKLFFYDISYLDTIAKTVVFVALGVLLLIISFLYNKYKDVLLDEKEV